mmetsp:Transcript_22373/g.34636  ORF Transcript_22373/g.34636 Transcript_22373/m.34636 type:complete len:80 (+) Transcript_22373:894-1133(+)
MNADELSYRIQHTVLISPHRVITELKTKHVLTMLPIDVKEPSPMSLQNEFKLAIGYYAKYIQVFDIMSSSDNQGYVFID